MSNVDGHITAYSCCSRLSTYPIVSKYITDNSWYYCSCSSACCKAIWYYCRSYITYYYCSYSCSAVSRSSGCTYCIADSIHTTWRCRWYCYYTCRWIKRWHWGSWCLWRWVRYISNRYCATYSYRCRLSAAIYCSAI